MLNNKDLSGMIPEIDPNYFLSQGIIKNLNRIEKLSKRHPVNILIVGSKAICCLL